MGLFADLVSKLYNEEDPAVQEEAIIGLVKFASRHANRWEISEFPDALAGLVRLLFRDELPILQEFAAWALGNLSGAHSPSDNKQKIAEFPQVLSGLVRLILRRDEHPACIQEEAARALRNLACSQENNRTIAQFPDAFPALLNLLFDDSSPGVQIQATMAVLNLVGNAMASRDGIIIRKQRSGNDCIVASELPDALECLVTLCFSEASSGLRVQACSAIVNLVEHTLVNLDLASKDSASGRGPASSGNMLAIANFPDALSRLVRSLLLEGGKAPHGL